MGFLAASSWQFDNFAGFSDSIDLDGVGTQRGTGFVIVAMTYQYATFAPQTITVDVPGYTLIAEHKAQQADASVTRIKRDIRVFRGRYSATDFPKTITRTELTPTIYAIFYYWTAAVVVYDGLRFGDIVYDGGDSSPADTLVPSAPIELNIPSRRTAISVVSTEQDDVGAFDDANGFTERVRLGTVNADPPNSTFKAASDYIIFDAGDSEAVLTEADVPDEAGEGDTILLVLGTYGVAPTFGAIAGAEFDTSTLDWGGVENISQTDAASGTTWEYMRLGISKAVMEPTFSTTIDLTNGDGDPIGAYATTWAVFLVYSPSSEPPYSGGEGASGPSQSTIGGGTQTIQARTTNVVVYSLGAKGSSGVEDIGSVTNLYGFTERVRLDATTSPIGGLVVADFEHDEDSNLSSNYPLYARAGVGWGAFVAADLRQNTLERGGGLVVADRSVRSGAAPLESPTWLNTNTDYGASVLFADRSGSTRGLGIIRG